MLVAVTDVMTTTGAVAGTAVEGTHRRKQAEITVRMVVEDYSLITRVCGNFEQIMITGYMETANSNISNISFE